MTTQPEITPRQHSATEPPVDDLNTSRGVVLSRAFLLRRSVETQPLAGRFALFEGSNLPVGKVTAR